MKHRNLTPLLLLLTASALADEAPDQSVAVSTIRANGSGCPSGSVSTAVAPDNRTFSVLFDRYIAEAGGNVPADKKACEIEVEVEVPSGWSFTIFSADYRGFASVENGATAFHQVLYMFEGVQSGPGPGPRLPAMRTSSPGRPVTKKGTWSFNSQEFRGPYDGDYTIHNELPLSTLAWSPCDEKSKKTLVINTALLARVLNPRSGARASLTLDSADGALDQRFGIKWRQCSNPAPTLASVYRFSNGRDNLLSNDPSEGARLGYQNMGSVFKVFATPIEQGAPLYRCLTQGQGHFQSLDASCEGGRREGVLGFVSQRPLEGGSIALASYMNKQNRADRIVLPMQGSGDFGRYRFLGIVGYVPQH